MPTDTVTDAGHSNGHGHEARNGPSNEARGNPFIPDPTKPGDSLTQIRVPRSLVWDFDAWYEGQAPDARQRVSKDHYYQVAFRLGLEQLQAALPPVKSLDERLAEKFGSK